MTFDFGDMAIVNRQFSDFKVYKWNNGRDLGNLEWARYVRVQGTSNLPPGGTNGYDFDALGAFELMSAPPIPEPSSAALMLAGLAWLARRRLVSQ